MDTNKSCIAPVVFLSSRLRINSGVGVTGGMALIIGIGAYLESNALMGIGVFAFFIFLVGYVPYMVRKAAEIMK